MRVNRTYSLAYSTIKELNDRISAKHRSKFVDKAIKSRLNGDEIDWNAVSSGLLMMKLARREDISDFVRKAIELELKS